MSLLIILNNIKNKLPAEDIKNCDECRVNIECEGISFNDCPFRKLDGVQREINYINNRK